MPKFLFFLRCTSTFRLPPSFRRNEDLPRCPTAKAAGATITSPSSTTSSSSHAADACNNKGGPSSFAGRPLRALFADSPPLVFALPNVRRSRPEERGKPHLCHLSPPLSLPYLAMQMTDRESVVRWCAAVQEKSNSAAYSSPVCASPSLLRG